jgi:hypothetical protein
MGLEGLANMGEDRLRKISRIRRGLRRQKSVRMVNNFNCGRSLIHLRIVLFQHQNRLQLHGMSSGRKLTCNEMRLFRRQVADNVCNILWLTVVLYRLAVGCLLL